MITRALVLLPALILAAPAATISFTFNGTVNSSSVRRSLDSGTTWTNQTIGQMSVTVTGSSGFAGYVPTNFFTFCIEPAEGVSAGSSYTYDIDPLSSAPTNVSGGMGSVKADLLRELYATYYPSFGASLSVVNASALQMATWEIVRETTSTYNVTNGSIRFQDATTPNPNYANIVLTANNMLAAITPAGGTLLNELYAIRKVGNQDLAFHAVPEPTSLALLSAGLVLLGRRRRSTCASNL